MAVDRVESPLGKTAVTWYSPDFRLSEADRLVYTSTDGTSAFVQRAKAKETAGGLRNEHRVLNYLRGTSLVPEVLGWQDYGAD